MKLLLSLLAVASVIATNDSSFRGRKHRSENLFIPPGKQSDSPGNSPSRPSKKVKSPLEIVGAAGGTGKKAGVGRINSAAFGNLKKASNNGESVTIEGFPLNSETNADLDVTLFNVLTDDSTTEVGYPGGRVETIVPTVKTYHGTVHGSKKSSVFLAITDSGVNGFIQTEDDQGDRDLFVVSNDNQGLSEVYNAKEANLKFDKVDDVVLEVPDSDDVGAGDRFLRHMSQAAQNMIPDEDKRSLQTTVVQKCYRVAVYCYDEFMDGSGDALYTFTTQQKIDYAYTIMAAVSASFTFIQNWSTGELDSGTSFQIFLQVGHMRVQDGNGSDFNKKSSNYINSKGLDDLRRWGENKAPADWNYHVLIGLTSACGPSGGIAWLSSICSSYRYGLAGCIEGRFPKSTTLNSQTWDLVVTAHELGHNFGAYHTHDNGIDTCASDCDVPAGGGTIMSYCHTCTGGMRNIDVRFHPVTIQQISGEYKNTNSNCVAMEDNDQCKAFIVNNGLPYGGAPTTCSSASDCDDGLACTDDTCDTTNGACVYTPVSCANACLEPNGDCVDCIDDNDCSVTNFCNATNSCATCQQSNDLNCAESDCATGNCAVCNDGYQLNGSGGCEVRTCLPSDGSLCKDGDCCSNCCCVGGGPGRCCNACG